MFYFIMGAMTTTSSVLRGAGDMGWFMSVSLVNLFLRVSLTFLLADATAGMIIIWANPVGWIVGLMIGFSRQLMQKMDGEVFAEIKEDDFCATVVVRKA